MDELERQKLWVRLQSKTADLEEECARALADGDSRAVDRHLKSLCDVQSALSHLRSAAAIREMLAKIELVGVLHNASDEATSS